MSTATIILLGAFAGLTIYLGLPLAFLKRAPKSFKTFASTFATGVLLFLFFDVISKGTEPINSALETLRTQHVGAATVFLEIFMMIAGFLVGLLGLVYFNTYVIARYKPGKRLVVEADTTKAAPALVGSLVRDAVASAPEATEQPRTVTAPGVVATAIASARVPSPKMLALMIAIGIGLHNFSEGLAIGQSAATGAISLATILIVGFGLHNMTEGFGIAGPLTTEKVSWKFIALVGLIGGGPTFLGTVVGMTFRSDLLFILFLALAAGSILYVVVELLTVAKRMASNELIMWGLLAGFMLGYLTDLIVTYAGA